MENAGIGRADPAASGHPAKVGGCARESHLATNLPSDIIPAVSPGAPELLAAPRLTPTLNTQHHETY